MFVYSDVEDEQCRGYGFCVTSVTWLSDGTLAPTDLYHADGVGLIAKI